MRVLVINTSEPLPFDLPAPRSQRTGMLVNELLARGHEVVWIASGFNHHSKSYRVTSGESVEVRSGLKFVLLKSPRYLKNVSIMRFLNHMILGLRFRKYLLNEAEFDVIYCSFPTIELAYVAANYAAASKTPILIDARDRWPELIVEQFPRYSQAVVRTLLRPYFLMAKSAFRKANAISGTSDGMVDFGIKMADRPRSDVDRAFFMSFQAPSFSDAEIMPIAENYRSLGSEGKESLVICFFGTFVSQRAVDFETCIDGIQNLPRNLDVTLIMCGNGPRYEATLARCEGIDSIILPGRVSAKEMMAISSISDFGLLPYRPVSHFEFSIPNKIPEYLANGLPVITSLTHGTVHEILKESDLGVFYESGNPESFVEALTACAELKSKKVMPQKSNAAKSLYLKMFDDRKINCDFSRALENLGGH